MCRQPVQSLLPERREGRPRRKPEKMARAAAVAGAESPDGSSSSPQAPEDFRPLVFSGHGVAAEPYALQGGRRSQVVDMPVPSPQRAEVPEAARPQTAGAEGAADIHIPAAGDRLSAEPADPHLPGTRAEQQEGIGAARGGNCLRFR